MNAEALAMFFREQPHMYAVLSRRQGYVSTMNLSASCGPMFTVRLDDDLLGTAAFLHRIMVVAPWDLFHRGFPVGDIVQWSITTTLGPEHRQWRFKNSMIYRFSREWGPQWGGFTTPRFSGQWQVGKDGEPHLISNR
jgi:hypothetical protein